MPKKQICPDVGKCTSRMKNLCLHAAPHKQNDLCSNCTASCVAICAEATPELLRKIEAEKIITNF